MTTDEFTDAVMELVDRALADGCTPSQLAGCLFGLAIDGAISTGVPLDVVRQQVKIFYAAATGSPGDDA